MITVNPVTPVEATDLGEHMVSSPRGFGMHNVYMSTIRFSDGTTITVETDVIEIRMRQESHNENMRRAIADYKEKTETRLEGGYVL